MFSAGGPGVAGNLFERVFGHRARPGPPRGAGLETKLVILPSRVMTGQGTVTIARPGPLPRMLAQRHSGHHAPPVLGLRWHGQPARQYGHPPGEHVPGLRPRGAIIGQPCPVCQAPGNRPAGNVTAHAPAGIPDGTPSTSPRP